MYASKEKSVFEEGDMYLYSNAVKWVLNYPYAIFHHSGLKYSYIGGIMSHIDKLEFICRMIMRGILYAVLYETIAGRQN